MASIPDTPLEDLLTDYLRAVAYEMPGRQRQVVQRRGDIRAMRTLIRLIVLALPQLVAPAFAAQTVSQSLSEFQGAAALTNAAFASVSDGQNICLAADSSNNSGCGAPAGANGTINASLDATNPINCGFVWDPTNAQYVGLHCHQAVTARARTVTITAPDTTGREGQASVVIEFIGTATCDGVRNVAGFSVTAAPTSALSPASTWQNCEIAFDTTTPADPLTLIGTLSQEPKPPLGGCKLPPKRALLRRRPSRGA
jgi:hypothetical protein